MSELVKRDRKVVWHPFSPLKGGYPMKGIVKGEGVYIHTEDGQKLLDGISSWWVNSLGHSNPELVEALNRQAKDLEHVIFAGFTHEPGVRLAEELIARLPSNQERIFYSDDGSTAVEVGLKMAMQYWQNKGIQRSKVIAIDGAYHGDTFGAMAVGERGTFTRAFHPYLFDVEFIPFPGNGQERRAVEAMQHACAGGDVACFIFEPLVQGAAGMRMYSPEVLSDLMAIAHKNEVICIADEIFTGFYRTGTFLATEQADHDPDIICLSKALTAGMLPLSVTSASSRIVQAFESDKVEHTFFHGHSFTANPLGCAVALASLEILDRRETRDQLNMISRKQEVMAEELDAHTRLTDVRNRGTILAMELKTGAGTSYFNDMRMKIYDFFMAQDILLRPLGNVIYFLPPYVITEDEVDRVHEAIRQFLASEKGS